MAASNGPSSYYPEVSTNDDANIVGQKIPQMPHNHVDPGTKVTYEHNPPTSGCHYNLDKAGKSQFAPIKPGVYTQSVDPEYWVHNLEHGYVVVVYDEHPTLPLLSQLLDDGGIVKGVRVLFLSGGALLVPETAFKMHSTLLGSLGLRRSTAFFACPIASSGSRGPHSVAPAGRANILALADTPTPPAFGIVVRFRLPLRSRRCPILSPTR